MADNYTKVTTTSWGSRLGNSIKGVLFGLLLFIVAFPVLFWNEGRSVKRYKTLKEGRGLVVSVAVDKVDAANDGKLIHVTGTMTTESRITDPEFNVTVQALRLIRNVEMYQWIEEKKTETKKKIGGGTEEVTTYNYKKDWSSNVIDSSKFDTTDGHQNPGSMPYKSGAEVAANVTLGAFTVPSRIVESFGTSETYDAGNTNAPRGMSPYNGGYYVGYDPSNPRIGDVRVTFSVVNPQEASIVSKQKGQSFEPYETKNGNLELVKTGTMTADQMFTAAEKENKMMTWFLRILGFFIMFVGISMVLKPISVVLDVLPILGNIAEIGIGIVAFLIALPLSLITIAIAWLYYRPVLAIILLAVSGAAIYFLVTLKHKKTATAQ